MIRSKGPRPLSEMGESTVGTRKPQTASPRKIIILVLAFSIAFATIVGLKLNQEWAADRAAAEASQARTAAFIAEQISGRMLQIQGALDMAVLQLEDGNDARDQAVIFTLAELPAVHESAILRPSGPILSTQALSDEQVRAAAETALNSDQGIGVSDREGIRLSMAEPVELADGTVGALVVIISPDELLPDTRRQSAVMITDNQGRLLTMTPRTNFTGAPYAAERLGLDPERVVAMAERGGAISGVQLAGESRILGTAAVGDAPIHILSLGTALINTTLWRETLIFHALLFLGPLGTALALLVILRTQMARLNNTRVQLLDSENRLRLAITGARCGVFEWDLETDEVVLTDSFASLFGRSGAEVTTGPEFLLLLRNDDRSRMRAALRGAAETSDLDVEVRAASLPVWMQLRGRLKDGTRRVIGIAIDITERKGAQARVAAAENRLRAALESMSESFVLWDARKRLVLWNRKFAEFFAFPAGKLRPGISYSAVETAAAQAIRQIHTEEDTASDLYDLELSDGRWLRYSERATADGGLVSVGADITAMKSQETALKKNDRDLRRTVENLRLSQERVQELAANYEQEKIRAEEANRSKSEFLANMSHELRTPLNAINGFSEIMAGELFGPLGDARYGDYVKDILNSGQHLLSLINDILDMSKIEAGKMQLQPEPIEPEEIIEQCVRIMRARAEEKSIQLLVECEEMPRIEADPRAVKQVLLNLMSNAVKFTPETGQVHVRGFNATDGVVLQVADTGIGIAEEDLPRLGRPFEQIESQHSKSHQGSGLGLALSKSLIEMHGGTLRIDSVLKKGTTVSFCLPLIAEVSDDPDQLEDDFATAEGLEDIPAF